MSISPFISPSRFSFSPLFCSLLFSSLFTIINYNEINNYNNIINHNLNPKINESEVLKELSSLLPIKQSNLIPNFTLINNQSEEIRVRVRVSHDGFLQLDDKLRGVFIQKLKIKSLLENALDNALGDNEIDIDVISRVLNRGNLGGDSMVMFFNWVIAKKDNLNNVAVYNVVLKALGRRKYFDYMTDLFDGMSGKGVRQECETVMIVVDSFARARRVNPALELVGKLGKFGVVFDVEVFNVVLRCWCKRMHVGVANSLMNSMKGKVALDVVSYNVVIGGWARLVRVCEMEKCLKGMVDDGVSLNCETYSCLVECLGRAGQVGNAVKIFRSMERDGCRPDTRVYNAMTSNHVSLGDFDECMKYYEEMCRNDCSPDLDTYTRLISGLLKARKVADALELFDVMLHRGVLPTIGTITTFIEPLCSYGPPHAAMMVYKSAKKAGC